MSCTSNEPRNYPIPRPSEDPRFTIGLGIDVAAVLQRHGFPAVTGRDMVDLLHIALFGFIYEPPTPAQARGEHHG